MNLPEVADQRGAADRRLEGGQGAVMKKNLAAMAKARDGKQKA